VDGGFGNTTNGGTCTGCLPTGAQISHGDGEFLCFPSLCCSGKCYQKPYIVECV
jgi:hypothetical protein